MSGPDRQKLKRVVSSMMKAVDKAIIAGEEAKNARAELLRLTEETARAAVAVPDRGGRN